MAAPIYSPNSSPVTQHARLFLGATDFIASGGAVLTRGAKGKWYWAVAASQTVYFAAALKTILRTFNNSVVNYAYAGKNNAPLSLSNITACYLSSAVAPTTLTVGLTQVDFPATGTATTPTVTDLLAPTALTATINADLYATVVTPANNALLPYNTSELIAEVAVVTPGGGTFQLHGLILDLVYNV
jgi:hypothetical protein